MSDSTTIARPYAKALFEQALANKTLEQWSAVLTTLSGALTLPETVAFVNNPSIRKQYHSDLLLSLFSNMSKLGIAQELKNFIDLLAEYGRLLALPEICTQFDALRKEYEKTLTVQVKCFSPMTESQQQRLKTVLSKKIQREVSLIVQVDASLLGGAVIVAGNLVIDGSVQSQLQKLASRLSA